MPYATTILVKYKKVYNCKANIRDMAWKIDILVSKNDLQSILKLSLKHNQLSKIITEYYYKFI